MTFCSICSHEMSEDEAQCCQRCGLDVLCDSCIGELDHPCHAEPDDLRARTREECSVDLLLRPGWIPPARRD